MLSAQYHRRAGTTALAPPHDAASLGLSLVRNLPPRLSYLACCARHHYAARASITVTRSSPGTLPVRNAYPRWVRLPVVWFRFVAVVLGALTVLGGLGALLIPIVVLGYHSSLCIVVITCYSPQLLFYRLRLVSYLPHGYGLHTPPPRWCLHLERYG